MSGKFKDIVFADASNESLWKCIRERLLVEEYETKNVGVLSEIDGLKSIKKMCGDICDMIEVLKSVKEKEASEMVESVELSSLDVCNNNEGVVERWKIICEVWGKESVEVKLGGGICDVLVAMSGKMEEEGMCGIWQYVYDHVRHGDIGIDIKCGKCGGSSRFSHMKYYGDYSGMRESIGGVEYMCDGWE